MALLQVSQATEAFQPEEPTQSAMTEANTPIPRPRLRPVGLKNDYNTCFLNSTFQALSATSALTSLIHTSPISPLILHPNSILPPPAVPHSQIPSLYPQILEPPLYGSLPITHTFISLLQESFRRKDEGYGDGQVMKLTNLLRAISAKHPHYNEFDQQDAHELLRQLLDSMELEEKDAIKLLQPRQSDESSSGIDKERSSIYKNGQALQIEEDSMSNEQRGEDEGTVKDQLLAEKSTFNLAKTGKGVGQEQNIELLAKNMAQAALIPNEQKLIPFVDVLFGGELASVVVCEKCKALSHTYEGFFDISLSISEGNRLRKRDRVFAFASLFASRLRTRSSSSKNTPPEGLPSPLPFVTQAISDNEISDSEVSSQRLAVSKRRKSLNLEEDGLEEGAHRLGRNKTFGGLKGKRLSFRKKRLAKPSSASSSLSSTPAFDAERNVAAAPTPIQSAYKSHESQESQARPHHHGKRYHAGPTPAQAAYIARILAPPATAEMNDPIARLRAAQSLGGSPNNKFSIGSESLPTETDLERSLREFTSVEVLEGPNAFACQKCWKIKHRKYAYHEATLREENEYDNTTGDMTPAALKTASLPVSKRPSTLSMPSETSVMTSSSIGSLSLPSPRVPPPSMSIHNRSDSNSSSSRDDRSMPMGRVSSLGFQLSTVPPARARSPLRRQIENEETLTNEVLNTTMDQSFTSQESNSGSFIVLSEAEGDVENANTPSESDGLSDSETETEEEEESNKPEKKSKHFVMGRAFKRYLIARSPEVLVFQLKRFKALSQTMTRFTTLKKMDEFVSFPEHLDLAPYLAPNRKDYKLSQTPHGLHAPYMDWENPMQGPEHVDPVMYRLYGVVVHIGDMISGHYVAYVLVDPDVMFSKGESINQKEDGEALDMVESNKYGAQDTKAEKGQEKEDRRVWVYCSDEIIREVKVEEVLNAKAYLCFYERKRV
ncbi:uncharacterized protein L203_101917 [Cryptococcus depauperatus CBS 7841]|uniref:Ubiquitin carboxyl-terminal hydrolase n=1 Tax=Cryptococcus depauperatus CBS 7841 TaxID=1295531 RepID=A0AAJ8LZT3_9TREE